MHKYQATRRFQIVAMVVLEISLKSKGSFTQVSMMGDMFTRWMLAVPLKDEGGQSRVRSLIIGFLSRGPLRNCCRVGDRLWLGVLSHRCVISRAPKCRLRQIETRIIFITVERLNRTFRQDLQRKPYSPTRTGPPCFPGGLWL